MRTKLILGLLCITALAFPFSMVNMVLAEGAHAAMETSRQALNEESFTVVKTLQAVPQSVRDRIGKDFGYPTCMADTNQPFNAGCTRGIHEPCCRLILGANSAKHCLLFYEKGGRALQHRIAMFALDEKTCKLIWTASTNFDARNVKTFGQLKESISGGKIIEQTSL